MRIGYFADGPWSHVALNKILAERDISIAFICVRWNSNDTVLPMLAAEYGIPCLRNQNINSEDFLKTISVFSCDLYVSMSFDQIFRKTILDSVPGGIINCHAGKLPFYRGRNVLNWVLINDEKEFGITVHHVDEGIDTGDIILQKVFPISDEDDYSTLLQTAYVGCAEVLIEALVLIKRKVATRTRQSSIHPVGSYCGRRREGDEIIDWNQSSRDLFNFARAICHPGPKATAKYKGSLVLINKINLVDQAPNYKGLPGQILAKSKEGWIVKSKDSFVEITNLEMASNIKICAGDRFGE